MWLRWIETLAKAFTAHTPLFARTDVFSGLCFQGINYDFVSQLVLWHSSAVYSCIKMNGVFFEIFFMQEDAKIRWGLQFRLPPGGKVSLYLG